MRSFTVLSALALAAPTEKPTTPADACKDCNQTEIGAFWTCVDAVTDYCSVQTVIETDKFCAVTVPDNTPAQAVFAAGDVFKNHREGAPLTKLTYSVANSAGDGAGDCTPTFVLSKKDATECSVSEEVAVPLPGDWDASTSTFTLSSDFKIDIKTFDAVAVTGDCAQPGVDATMKITTTFEHEPAALGFTESADTATAGLCEPCVWGEQGITSSLAWVECVKNTADDSCHGIPLIVTVSSAGTVAENKLTADFGNVGVAHAPEFAPTSLTVPLTDAATAETCTKVKMILGDSAAGAGAGTAEYDVIVVPGDSAVTGVVNLPDGFAFDSKLAAATLVVDGAENCPAFLKSGDASFETVWNTPKNGDGALANLAYSSALGVAAAVVLLA